MSAKAIAAVETVASEDRGALARMVMKLLEHWQLSTEDQAALLGLAASSRAALDAIDVAKRSAAAATSSSASDTCSASTRACDCCFRRTPISPTAG